MPKYYVERSTRIDAEPEKVFETVADYSTWTTWSPWLCAEPDAEVKVTEDSSSVGSVYSWSGEIVGAGEVEHLSLTPAESIDDEIRFFKPFKSKSNVGFKLKPAGAGTSITWYMDGSLPWFLFWMRSMMETFIGMDYERGLSMLKEWVETGQILSKTTVRGVESIGPLAMAGIRSTCAMSEIGPKMEAAMSQARDQLSQAGLPTDGEGISVYHKLDMKARTFDFTSGYLLPSLDNVPADMSSWSIPKLNALATEHIGSYQNLGNAWSAANQVVRYKKHKQARKTGCFEIYRNTPVDTAPADLRTEIHLPLK